MKTGLFSKLFIVLGIVLLLIFLVETFLHPIGLSDGVTGAMLAFAILCIGLGVLLYFFVLQFAKLSEIAEEIEADESLCDVEEEPQKEKPTT
jgi:Zn-dependent protease with chaperone function